MTRSKLSKTIVVAVLAVFGIGGLGHLALQYARIAGAFVIAVDVEDHKLELATRLGADHVINASREDPAEAIQRLGGADVAVALGIDGHAVPSGFRVSRPPRTRLLRSARVTIASRTFHVRVRDISITGAMIEGLPAGSVDIDTDLLIELVEHQPIAARVSRVRSTFPPFALACASSLFWRIIAWCTGPCDHSVGPVRQPGASLLFQEVKKPSGGSSARGRCDGEICRNV